MGCMAMLDEATLQRSTKHTVFKQFEISIPHNTFDVQHVDLQPNLVRAGVPVVTHLPLTPVAA